MYFKNATTLALVVILIIVVVSSGADSQITFSRDWLAGSGKRSLDSKNVHFSRDWLASGKRAVITGNPRDDMCMARAAELICANLLGEVE